LYLFYFTDEKIYHNNYSNNDVLVSSILFHIHDSIRAGRSQFDSGANMSVVPVKKTAILHVVPEHESAQQIRDEIRSNHPLLAAIADKIQTMDERETLRYTLGVEIVSDLLKMHAEDLIRNQTAR